MQIVSLYDVLSGGGDALSSQSVSTPLYSAAGNKRRTDLTVTTEARAALPGSRWAFWVTLFLHIFKQATRMMWKTQIMATYLFLELQREL